MSMNIAFQQEQQQRIENDVAALEHQIEWESIEGIKREGREDGREGKWWVKQTGAATQWKSNTKSRNTESTT